MHVKKIQLKLPERKNRPVYRSGSALLTTGGSALLTTGGDSAITGLGFI